MAEVGGGADFAGAEVRRRFRSRHRWLGNRGSDAARGSRPQPGRGSLRPGRRPGSSASGRGIRHRRSTRTGHWRRSDSDCECRRVPGCRRSSRGIGSSPDRSERCSGFVRRRVSVGQDASSRVLAEQPLRRPTVDRSLAGGKADVPRNPARGGSGRDVEIAAAVDRASA